MAIELGTGYVSLAVSSRGVGRDLIKGFGDVPKGFEGLGRQSGDRFQQSFGRRAVGKIGGVLRAGLVGAAGTAIAAMGVVIAKGFSRLSAIEQAEQKLMGLGNSAKAVEKIMSDALASVRGTAFGMDEAATTAATAVAAGIKPGKELEGYLKLTADAATIAGTSMSEMGSIFNKVATSNKVDAEIFNQLQDRGIPIMQLLAKSMNKSNEEILAMRFEGAITFDMFQKAMTQGVGGAALSSGKTVVGAWKNTWAAVSRIGANVLKGVFPQIRGALTGITAFLGRMEPVALVVGKSIGDALSRAAGAAQLFIGTITGQGSDADVPTAWMNPIIDAGARVSSIFDGMKSTFAALQPVAKEVFGLIGTYVTASAKNWGALFSQLGPQLLGLIREIAPVAQTIIQTVTSILTRVLPIVGEVASMIGGLIVRILPGIQKILAAVGEAVRVILPVVQSIISTLMDALRDNWPAIETIFNAIGSIVGQVFGLIALRVREFAVLFSAVWQALGPILLPLIANVFGTLVKIISGAFTIIDGLVKVITGVLTGDFSLAGEGLKQIVGGLWQVITAVFSGAINGLKITFGGLVTFLIDKTQGLRDGIAAIFAKIGSVFTWLYQNVARPIFENIARGWGVLAKAVDIVWRRVLSPILYAVGKIITVLARVWFLGAMTIIKAAWSGTASLLKTIYNGVIKPVINFFAERLRWSSGVMLAVGRAIQTAFTAIGTKFRDVYNRYLKPILGFFGDRMRQSQRTTRDVGSSIRNAFGAIGTKIRDVYNRHIKPILSAFSSVIKNLAITFGRGATTIGTEFNKIRNAVKEPIDFVVRTVLNNGIIAGFDWLAGKVGVTGFGDIPWPPDGWAQGGPVFGQGRQRRGHDRIPAWLDHEEHVWTRDEMSRFPGGHAAMEKWRAAVRSGRFAGGFKTGGRVWPGTTRSLSGNYRGHSGIDIPDPRGNPVYAAGPGAITYAGWGRGYGNAIFQSLPGGLEAVYGHTLRTLARVGQQVSAGQKIALVDSTGNSSGDHIHFEINGTGGFSRSGNRAFTIDWLKGAASGFTGASTEGVGEADSGWSPFDIFLAPFRSLIEKAVGGVSKITDTPLGKIIGAVPKMIVDGLINKAKSIIGMGDGSGAPGSFGSGVGRVSGSAGARARQAAAILGPMFGFSSISTYAGHDPSESRALDFMTKSKAQGDALAQYAKDHASQLGVMYAIWYRRIWSVARNREGWRAYTRYGNTSNPNQAHTNHVHLSFFGNGGVLPNDWAVVGERGPELIKMPGARVYSNEDSRKMINATQGPMKIEGTLDLGDGLTGFVRGVITTEARAAVNARN